MAEKRVLNKDVVLTVRTTGEIRGLLDDLAELDGRTATSEVEHLIRQEHKLRWSEIADHHEWKRKTAELRKE